jgi:hypothetical protein
MRLLKSIKIGVLWLPPNALYLKLSGVLTLNIEN